MEKKEQYARMEDWMPLLQERLAAGERVKFSPGGVSMLPMLRQGMAGDRFWLPAVLSVLGSQPFSAPFSVQRKKLAAEAFAATALMRRRLKELNKQVSEQDGRVSGFLQETMEKLLMAQAMDVSGEVERRSDLLLEDRYQLQRKRKNVSLAANMGSAS